MFAMRAAALALVLLVSGAAAQNQVCNLDSNWSTTPIAPTAFLGVAGVCPNVVGAASVDTCSQCICANLYLFQSGLDTAREPNATDLATGGFGSLIDYIDTCLTQNADQFSDVTGIEAGVAACLNDASFRSQLQGNVSNVGQYCTARFTPPSGTTTATNAPPSPDAADSIPPGEDSAPVEESSGEFVPTPPGVYPPPSVYPPGVYPPGTYPPSIFSPPSPSTGATISTANVALQAAVAVLCLLASAMLL